MVCCKHWLHQAVSPDAVCPPFPALSEEKCLQSKKIGIAAQLSSDGTCHVGFRNQRPTHAASLTKSPVLNCTDDSWWGQEAPRHSYPKQHASCHPCASYLVILYPHHKRCASCRSCAHILSRKCCNRLGNCSMACFPPWLVGLRRQMDLKGPAECARWTKIS